VGSAATRWIGVRDCDHSIGVGAFWAGHPLIIPPLVILSTGHSPRGPTKGPP
jgi:hypothetical protein